MLVKPESTGAIPDVELIPVVCCLAEEVDDIRHHLLKFQSRNNVDPKLFEPPVRLHRKDPKNLQFQLLMADIAERTRQNEELERLEQQQKYNPDGTLKPAATDEDGTPLVADMLQVAPDLSRPRRLKKFRKLTRQVVLMDEDKRQLRYEEYYPWVLEDYHGRNTFVGSYEAGTLDTYVFLVYDKAANVFKMVPANKVYKFLQRNKYATLTLEEAEERMEKKKTVLRWHMRNMQQEGESNGEKDQRFRRTQQWTPGIRTVVGGGGSSRTNADRDLDHDDLDFDEEFADDEEAPIMDGDVEENKLSEQRMKREMLKANAFDDAEDDDDMDDLFGDRKEDKEGRRMRKTLAKREMNGGLYDSDEEEANPYILLSDLEDKEDEEDKVKLELAPTIPPPNKALVLPTDGRLVLPKRRKRVTRVQQHHDGFVIIKSNQQVLSHFPKGEWNPGITKRAMVMPALLVPVSSFTLAAATPVAGGSDSEPIIKAEPGTAAIPEGRLLPEPFQPLLQPQSSATGGDSRDGLLVTAVEVVQAVRDGALTLRELLQQLLARIRQNPENKKRVVAYAKEHLKLISGRLVVKGEE